jgi:hypothetical protein
MAIPFLRNYIFKMLEYLPLFSINMQTRKLFYATYSADFNGLFSWREQRNSTEI